MQVVLYKTNNTTPVVVFLFVLIYDEAEYSITAMSSMSNPPRRCHYYFLPQNPDCRKIVRFSYFGSREFPGTNVQILKIINYNKITFVHVLKIIIFAGMKTGLYQKENI